MRRLARITSLALLLAAAAVGCLGNGPTALVRGPSAEGDRWILFIGNSHTYVEDVPQLVVQIARQGGDSSLRTARVAQPNFSLEDHWATGVARAALEDYDWHHVVMQQGPSAQGTSPLHLLFWTQQFAPLARAAGAEPMLYQVWPSVDRREDAAAALIAYRNAAGSVGGVLAPAGDAFTAALDADPAAGVYAADGLHASIRGAYLAALTIVGRINDLDPRTLPPVIPGRQEDSLVVRALQAAAALALERNAARP
jgi:hypothetical protein